MNEILHESQRPIHAWPHPVGQKANARRFLVPRSESEFIRTKIVYMVTSVAFTANSLRSFNALAYGALVEKSI